MAAFMDVMQESFSRYLAGFSLSKAIFEDYVKVIAKFENVPEEEVKERILKRNEEIFEEAKAKIESKTQEYQNAKEKE